jgi:uncharacterized membrane protein
MARGGHENLDERLLHRLLFFTDAVFAIVMTLLVLELRPPADGAGLLSMAGRFFSFGMSFTILGIFWLAHMSTTRRLAAFDWPTATANLAFLLPICLIPFVSAWIGERTGGGVAWTAYAAVMIATSLANVGLVLVQSRGGGRLIEGGMSGRERLYRAARASSAGLAFAVGLIGPASGHVVVAQFCWVLIPVFLLLFRRTLGRRAEAG